MRFVLRKSAKQRMRSEIIIIYLKYQIYTKTVKTVVFFLDKIFHKKQIN